MDFKTKILELKKNYFNLRVRKLTLLIELYNEYIDLIDITSLNSVAFFDECVNNMFYDIDFSLHTLFAKRLYELCLQMGLRNFINCDWMKLLNIQTLS